MYLVQTKIKGRASYILRHSYAEAGGYRHRDLFDLGEDPAVFILYPGGNAYYFDPVIEEALDALGVEVQGEELEDVFWPFLRPDIQRAVGHFRGRSRSASGRRKLNAGELDIIVRRSVTAFDKRRWHYLKFGNMDQGPLARMPHKLFIPLIEKSRDEIEQLFLAEESALPESELKSYVYTAFDLQRFFDNYMAKKMPHVLDQKRVDQYFMDEICRINTEIFRETDRSAGGGLNSYMVRYLIMFYDNPYAGTRLLDDYVQDFIYRHRFYKPPVPKPSISLDTAACILGLQQKDLATLSPKGLMRRFRRLAQQRHPDKGGSSEQFVELKAAYERLMVKIRNSK